MGAQQLAVTPSKIFNGTDIAGLVLSVRHRALERAAGEMSTTH